MNLVPIDNNINNTFEILPAHATLTETQKKEEKKRKLEKMDLNFPTLSNSNGSLTEKKFKKLSSSDNESSLGIVESVGDFVDDNGEGMLTLPNGDKYEGGFAEGNPHGKGTLTSEGIKFEVNFVYGKPKTFTTQDGIKTDFVVFEGDFIRGWGVTYNTNGTKYEGDFVYCKPHGKGTFTDKDGSKYKGDFVNGKKHGKGTLTKLSGFKYEGDFVDGEQHGKGILTKICGSKYAGDFVKGKPHGKGTLICIYGSKYQGDFVNDKKHGKGTFTWTDGSKYEGDFVDDEAQGKGILTRPDGSKYVGSFFHNEKHGRGEYMYPNGDIYIGGFSFGKRLGPGTYIWANGGKYEGQFPCTLSMQSDILNLFERRSQAQSQIELQNLQNFPSEGSSGGQ